MRVILLSEPRSLLICLSIIYLTYAVIICPNMYFPRRKIPLSLGVLLPTSYRHRIEPSIDLALKHIYNNENLLRNYCFNLVYKDTQVITSSLLTDFQALYTLFTVQNLSGDEISIRFDEF